MKNLNWDDLRYFQAVAQYGSATAAGTELSVAYTTVSRRISALEESLETKLFDRSSGKWAITAAGTSILKSVEAMADYAGEVRRNAFSETHEIEGTLRITSIGPIIERLLMPILKGFQEAYPNISLELIASMDPLSLSTREADFAFRLTDAPDENLIGRQIGTFEFAAYGSKDILDAYLAGKPVPVIVNMNESPHQLPDWVMKHLPPPPNVLRYDDNEVSLSACQHGFGVAVLPIVYASKEYMDQSTQLYKLPGLEADMSLDLWMLSHAGLRQTPRMRVFRDFVSDRLAQKIEKLQQKVPAANDMTL